MDSDPTGRSWLASLLALGSRSGDVVYPSDPGDLEVNHPRWWGSKERRLRAPTSLLEWLVSNVSKPTVEASGDKGHVLARRLHLAEKRPEVVAEALELIKKARQSRGWYLLEGESCPDACLETNRIILVVGWGSAARCCDIWMQLLKLPAGGKSLGCSSSKALKLTAALYHRRIGRSKHLIRLRPKC
jgi:hypothetical protein